MGAGEISHLDDKHRFQAIGPESGVSSDGAISNFGKNPRHDPCLQ